MIRETDTYVELEIIEDDVIVGYAEINTTKNILSRFKIYEPFQNKGHGTKALGEILQKYNVEQIECLQNNNRALRVYEKFGFVPKETCSVILKKGSL